MYAQFFFALPFKAIVRKSSTYEAYLSKHVSNCLNNYLDRWASQRPFHNCQLKLQAIQINNCTKTQSHSRTHFILTQSFPRMQLLFVVSLLQLSRLYENIRNINLTILHTSQLPKKQFLEPFSVSQTNNEKITFLFKNYFQLETFYPKTNSNIIGQRSQKNVKSSYVGLIGRQPVHLLR